MTEQEQINALKAQVNCLRDELRATHCFLWKASVADYIARDIEKALEATPEQCLAEVKAMVIEGLLVDLLHISPSKPIEFIQKRLANVKRDQAK